VAVTFCVTLAASLAARHGPTIMAGFQICCQLWLATSLLADGLAVAGQVRSPFRYRLDWLTEKLQNRKSITN
jgi:Na+-driven multidrug efflux pump